MLEALFVSFPNSSVCFLSAHLAKELSLPRQEDDGSEAKKKLMEARRKMTTPTMIPPASTPEAHREEG